MSNGAKEYDQSSRSIVVTTLNKALSRIFEYSGAARACGRLNAIGRQNSVFIWIPKNAGSSFFDLYHRFGNAPKCKTLHQVVYRFPQRGHVTFGHMDYANLVLSGYVSQEFDRSSYKFCFVRNPFARAVSLYTYLYYKNRDFAFLDFCRHLPQNGAHPIGPYNRKENSQCNPQIRWIENLEIDFVGRVENISDDVAQIMTAIGLKHESPQSLNASKHAVYSKYYCEESRDIIIDFYNEDFQRFEYPTIMPLDAT